MIRKLQVKLVAACMVLVTAVMAVVFVSLYYSLKQNVEQLSLEVLHRVVQNDSFQGSFPGTTPPEIGIDIGGDHVRLPYFTVEVWGSHAFVTGGTYANLEDTEILDAILNQCLAQVESEGTVPDYHMRYLRQNFGLYQKIAFVDMSMEQAMLRGMMGPYLVIAAISLLLLLAISVLFSSWATRPVEKAWLQQRQFLSDASHELKTPLTVILSNAELLADTPLDANASRWTDNVRSEARQMKALVEEMLTLAQADTLSRTQELAAVPLSDLAVSCALAFEPVAFEAGKSLTYLIDEGLHVIGEEDRLRQLISILLDNAIKYSPADAAICLSLRRLARQTQLVVSNPGPPIPGEHLLHIFERFYRADASRGEKSGFGLGLSIAKTIADDHKGVLRAESDEASTRFIFTLPLQK